MNPQGVVADAGRAPGKAFAIFTPKLVLGAFSFLFPRGFSKSASVAGCPYVCWGPIGVDELAAIAFALTGNRSALLAGLAFFLMLVAAASTVR
jgi:hypothetical protein